MIISELNVSRLKLKGKGTQTRPSGYNGRPARKLNHWIAIVKSAWGNQISVTSFGAAVATLTSRRSWSSLVGALWTGPVGRSGMPEEDSSGDDGADEAWRQLVEIS
ncbi:unnamed protein product [Phytophthora fragariaefolia]|uniref:Unnamed protein product n=1 Tax=Phytophthora fragariaefolia TaxID=1490495 RepID=A0A9W6Y0R6_9STRA|nr:unnamed protein product [Phytophthora fragariaefolia]